MPERIGPILYLAGGRRGVYCLRGLLDAGEPLAAVVGHPGSEADELARIAGEAGLPHRAPDHPNRADFLEWVGKQRVRLAIMSGYNRILRPAFLEASPEGVINLHGGPLPEYRGGSPLNWQILRGESSIGLSILRTDTGIDTGPVLARDRFDLGPDEAIDSVVERSLPVFLRLLLGVLERMRAGTLEAEVQDPGRARYFAKRLPEDGWIDWHALCARRVHDLVRALSGSYPGAFTFHRGRRIVIEATQRLEETIIGPPGRVLSRRAEGVEVACRDRALLVARVRDEGSGAILPAREALPPRNASFDRLPPLAESR